ncbi:MAG: NUDIX hydrolase [Bacillota bacterium]
MLLYTTARAIVEREENGQAEVLLQVRDRPGQLRRLELPGGGIARFEPILEALAREVREETGLTVTEILGETGRMAMPQVECLTPFFVYQSLSGPGDSTGFVFRCRAEGCLTGKGDGAVGHRWIGIDELRERLAAEPESFDYIALGALAFYLRWRQAKN